MRKIIMFILCLVALASFSACVGTTNKLATNNTMAPNTSTIGNITASAPTKDTLSALEKQAFEAWKRKDAKFFDGFLTDSFVGFGEGGRKDKAATIKDITNANCEVKSYSFSDEQVTPLNAEVALLTLKATRDYACNGRPGPPTTWSASIYVRTGDKWRGTYHNEIPGGPPADVPKNAPPLKNLRATEEKPGDELTGSLMAIEKQIFIAWKARDAKAVGELLSKDFISVAGSGVVNRADTIKGWTEPKCEIGGYTLSDAKAVPIAKDTAILTYRSNMQAACDGFVLQPWTWQTTVYVKEGDKWLMAFNIGSHAAPAGS